MKTLEMLARLGISMIGPKQMTQYHAGVIPVLLLQGFVGISRAQLCLSQYNVKYHGLAWQCHGSQRQNIQDCPTAEQTACVKRDKSVSQ